MIRIILVFLILSFSLNAFADEEVTNQPLVKSSEYGRYYAKSVPEEAYGSKGKTFLYAVAKGEDRLECTYDWFSNELQILDQNAVLVRFGPWARGRAANSKDTAIAFYKDCKELKVYSTLDIAGQPDHVSPSVSHYTVFQKILGFRWLGGNDFAFDVVTYDGSTLSFDVATGNIFTKEELDCKAVIQKIQELKAKWWVAHSPATQDVQEHAPTIDELKAVADSEFPEIPAGYHLNIGTFFEEPQLQKAVTDTAREESAHVHLNGHQGH